MVPIYAMGREVYSVSAGMTPYPLPTQTYVLKKKRFPFLHTLLSVSASLITPGLSGSLGYSGYSGYLYIYKDGNTVIRWVESGGNGDVLDIYKLR